MNGDEDLGEDEAEPIRIGSVPIRASELCSTSFVQNGEVQVVDKPSSITATATSERNATGNFTYCHL